MYPVLSDWGEKYQLLRISTKPIDSKQNGTESQRIWGPLEGTNDCGAK